MCLCVAHAVLSLCYCELFSDLDVTGPHCQVLLATGVNKLVKCSMALAGLLISDHVRFQQKPVSSSYNSYQSSCMFIKIRNVC